MHLIIKDIDWPIIICDSRQGLLSDEEFVKNAIKKGIASLLANEIPSSSSRIDAKLDCIEWEPNIISYDVMLDRAWEYTKENAIEGVNDARENGFSYYQQYLGFEQFKDGCVFLISNVLLPADIRKKGSITYAGSIAVSDVGNRLFKVDLSDE